MNEVQEMIHDESEFMRLDWSIVKRLIVLLHKDNRLKRTSLAMQSGLAYDKCALYLDWMNLMGIINKQTDESGFEVITLSDEGNALYATKFNNNDDNDLL